VNIKLINDFNDAAGDPRTKMSAKRVASLLSKLRLIIEDLLTQDLPSIQEVFLMELWHDSANASLEEHHFRRNRSTTGLWG